LCKSWGLRRVCYGLL
nr:immunoglobulin heavy chain junction region [Mus musculus]